MRLTIQRKIIIIITIVLLFSLGMNTAINVLQFQEDYKQVLITKVVVIGKESKYASEDILNSGISIDKLPKASEKCQNIVDQYEEIGYCYIANPEMKVLHHNDPSYVNKILLVPPPEETLSTEEAAIYFSSFENKKFYEVTLPLLSKGEQVGDIRLGIPVQVINDKTNPILLNSIVVMFISFGFAFLLCIFLAMTITKPIEKLHDTTEQLEKGNLNARAEINSGDEIEHFAHAFNRMASGIQKREQELREYGEHLEDIVKERTHELEEAMEKLKELDRMKDEFFTSATHDIQNPLTPVRGQSELLLRGHFGELNEKQRKSVETTLRNTNRLIRLTEDIMTMSRMRAGVLKYEMSENDINDIIENSIKNMKLRANEKKIAIIKKYPESLLVNCDKDRINQVMENLIVNAIKFTPENGKITIEAEKIKNDIIVSVEDTGSGISKENQKKLFKTFFQVSSKYGGTGLGLSICRSIIEAHHGKIWVESAISKGSKFTFTLPVL